MNLIFFDGFGIAVFFGLASVYGRFGYDQIQQAARLDPGVPLTRANTADLPAPDSLVRASEQPMQPQEAILLRPAAQYGEAHEKQLLRASTRSGNSEP